MDKYVIQGETPGYFHATETRNNHQPDDGPIGLNAD